MNLINFNFYINFLYFFSILFYKFYKLGYTCMLWFNSSLGLQLYMILNEFETKEDINQNNVYNY